MFEVVSFEGSPEELIDLQYRSIGRVDVPRHELEFFFRHRGSRFYAVYCDGILAGAAIVSAKFLRPWASLVYFAVDQQFRSSGISAELLRHAEMRTSRKRMRLFLRASSAPAIRFFEKHHYLLKKRRHNHYERGLDALVYVHKLR